MLESCEAVIVLKGETKARVRAAWDYRNRTDRPVNTCENLVSRRLRPRHRSFFRLALLASGKSDFSSLPLILSIALRVWGRYSANLCKHRGC
ncbi:uncharacterized protein LOC105426388 isoform X2 [Pogonomyrmex barbatus]|uniref:Uncharacterized protein LOC105426388 isoform X2 n=1 Tax=Pogonomyrmex barbatus TaxID=144034 RepID=A0A8N1S4N6_9HYME|nr:uncharacterized protein LOC105426388 isoform X2 [Pogonomyrmex barbatus]